MSNRFKLKKLTLNPPQNIDTIHQNRLLELEIKVYFKLQHSTFSITLTIIVFSNMLNYSLSSIFYKYSYNYFFAHYKIFIYHEKLIKDTMER